MRIDWEEIREDAQKALHGDKQRYPIFLKKIATYLKLKLARNLPLDSQEDVLQEILLAIHKSFHTLELSKSLQSWVNAIAKYKTSDYLRSYYQKELRTQELEEEVGSIDFDITEFKEIVSFMSLVLKPKEKEVLILLKYEGHTVNEVSTAMELSPQNIKVICHRAIKKLREELLAKDFYE